MLFANISHVNAADTLVLFYGQKKKMLFSILSWVYNSSVWIMNLDYFIT